MQVQKFMIAMTSYMFYENKAASHCFAIIVVCLDQPPAARSVLTDARSGTEEREVCSFEHHQFEFSLN